MVDVVQALQVAMDIVGKLRVLNKKVGEADFKMLLADLTSALGDAKLEAANLKIELASLTDEKERLAQALQKRESARPEIQDGAYIFDGRHYCTACFDISGRKVLLRELTGAWANFGKWECPGCSKTLGPSTL